MAFLNIVVSLLGKIFCLMELNRNKEERNQMVIEWLLCAIIVTKSFLSLGNKHFDLYRLIQAMSMKDNVCFFP